MKAVSFVLTAGLVGATSVYAAPYYVGENLTPPDHVSLGFSDTPTKKDTGSNRASTGNIATIEIKANYSPMENLDIRAGLPVYFATKKATTDAQGSRNAVGNISLGGNWNQDLSQPSDIWTWGYSAGGDIYFPTSRKTESNVVAAANAGTDFYRYYPLGLTFNPSVGLYLKRDVFSAKTNVGAGFMWIQKKGSVPSDQNRMIFNWQLASTWHAHPNMDANLELNTITLDKATAETGKKFRMGLTPSVSGHYDQILGQAFVTIPLDSTTRDVANVAFGINAGYMF